MTTHRPGQAVISVAALLTAWLVLSACTSPEEEATAKATDAVREQARDAQDSIAWTLNGGGINGDPLSTRLRHAASPGEVFGDQLLPDGIVQLDVAFTERRSAGGGLTYTDVTARLCIRYTGRAGSGADVVMTDVECSNNIPDNPNAPNVNITVGLED